MRHTRSRINSYDRQIAKVKGGNMMNEPLNMRPARAWDIMTAYKALAKQSSSLYSRSEMCNILNIHTRIHDLGPMQKNAKRM